jgi:acetyl esterase/lipase
MITREVRTYTHSSLSLLVTLVMLGVGCKTKPEPQTTAPILPPLAAAEAETEPTMVGEAVDVPALGTTEYSVSRLNGDQTKVIEALAGLHGKPIASLTPEEARQQPTPADAVKAVLTEGGKPTSPEAVGKVEDRQIPGPAGKLSIRIYTPREGKAPYPLILYFHGGGFVIASNDVYDATARAIANAAKAVVVAVDYRLAPEHKFPAAHLDASAAYTWLLRNGATMQGDPTRIAVLGESAGGNLAANVALAARDHREKLPVAVVLVYPLASGNLESESYREHARARPLNKAMMSWFMGHFFRTPEDAKDPRIDLVHADWKGLPPVTIINAEVDPLRSEGELLAKTLEAAGVAVKQRTFEGVAHEFFGQGAVLDDARQAVELVACTALRGVRPLNVVHASSLALRSPVQRSRSGPSSCDGSWAVASAAGSASSRRLGPRVGPACSPALPSGLAAT